MRPLIGVMPQIDDQRIFLRMHPGHFTGIEEAGGLPIMLPLTEDEEIVRQSAALCDGFLFPGGPDLAPEMYGARPLNETVVTYPPRDRLEKMMLEEAEKSGKPILGICRGLQFINVFHGGTLYQDLPEQHPTGVRHFQKPPFDAPTHRVTLFEGSPLQKLLGKDEVDVNSLHHQTVLDLGKGLMAMGESEDGLTEAICLPDHPFLWAVQWHPESMHKTDDNSKAIFRAFIDAVNAQKEKRL